MYRHGPDSGAPSACTTQDSSPLFLFFQLRRIIHALDDFAVLKCVDFLDICDTRLPLQIAFSMARSAFLSFRRESIRSRSSVRKIPR